MTDTSKNGAAGHGAAAYKRIATEEAWAPPELIKEYRRLLDNNLVDDPGFKSLWGLLRQEP